MLIALLALTLAGHQPVDTAISAIFADPAAHAGKRVRLTGQVDQCAGWDCAICPTDMTPATLDADRCLRLAFGPNELSAASDAAYRYADVTLVARFDPTCEPKLLPRGRDVVICTDRAPVLVDARVERVLRRRTSAVGLFNARSEPIRLADARTTADVTEAFRRVDGGLDDRIARRVFVWQSTDGALFCRARVVDRPAVVWPDRYETATVARSRADGFECHRARRIDGRWTILPG